MTSLIIGGTSSLGGEISKRLIEKEYKIITISRALEGILDSPHYSCDVLDKDNFRRVLNKIKKDNHIINNIWCVAGYAYPRRLEEQNEEIEKRHLYRNLSYVQVTLELLNKTLDSSNNPFVVTFGSQWSYRDPKDFPELIPYAKSKRALKEFIEKFSHPKIRVNHYCIPTTDTFAYRRITQTLAYLNRNIVRSHIELANPETVARSLIEHAFKYSCSGRTFVCSPNGSIKLLQTS